MAGLTGGSGPGLIDLILRLDSSMWPSALGVPFGGQEGHG